MTAIQTVSHRRFCAKKREVRRALGVPSEVINKHVKVVQSGVGELRDLKGDNGVLVYKTNSGGWWVARSADPAALAEFLESVATLRKYRDVIL